jgi:hypothetical protein
MLRRRFISSALLVLVLVVGAVPSVRAADYVLDQTTCSTLGGTWDPPRCIFNTPVSLPAGSTLTIPSGVIAHFQGSVTHRNAGTIIVYGGMLVNGGSTLLENSGQIQVQPGGVLQVFNDAILRNVCAAGVKGTVSGTPDVFGGGAYDDTAPCRPVVTTLPQCSGEGWRNVARADQSTFRNRGDCVSYVQNLK